MFEAVWCFFFEETIFWKRELWFRNSWVGKKNSLHIKVGNLNNLLDQKRKRLYNHEINLCSALIIAIYCVSLQTKYVLTVIKIFKQNEKY